MTFRRRVRSHTPRSDRRWPRIRRHRRRRIEPGTPDYVKQRGVGRECPRRALYHGGRDRKSATGQVPSAIGSRTSPECDLHIGWFRSLTKHRKSRVLAPRSCRLNLVRSVTRSNVNHLNSCWSTSKRGPRKPRNRRRQSRPGPGRRCPRTGGRQCSDSIRTVARRRTGRRRRLRLRREVGAFKVAMVVALGSDGWQV